MPCRIHNPSSEPVSLPFPFTATLRGGQSVVISLSLATVVAMLGTTPLQLSHVSETIASGEADDGQVIPYVLAGIPASLLADLAVATGKLANSAVTNAKIADGAISTSKLGGVTGAAGVAGGQVGNTLVLRRSFAAGAGGAADDVTVATNLAYGLQIVDVVLHVTTAGPGASTVTLRTAAAGGGTALSSDLAGDALALVRTTLVPSVDVAAGGSMYLRRSDSAIAGFIDLICVRA